MSTKKTLFIAAGVLACIGAVAAVSAQGHRQHWRGGPAQFGGDDGFGLGGHDMAGRGGFRERFAGPLTKDEFDAKTRERFARLDKNSDGVIDGTEIAASMTERMSAWRKMMNKDGPGIDDRMIRMFDTNKDGKVSKDEYQGVIRKQFAEMDLNNDGRITDEDLPPMMRGRNVLAGGQGPGLGAGMGPGMAPGMGPGAGQGVGGRPGMGFPLMRLLQGADANKDGIITLDEVLTAADGRFQQLDRNKDGAVDKADFDALRKEMVEYRVKRFIHHFGADKDGKVTREQFNAKATERFAQMDWNNDGTISRDERPGGGRWFGRGGYGGPGMGGSGDGMGPGGQRGPGGGPEGPRRGPGGEKQ